MGYYSGVIHTIVTPLVCESKCFHCVHYIAIEYHTVRVLIHLLSYVLSLFVGFVELKSSYTGYSPSNSQLHSFLVVFLI